MDFIKNVFSNLQKKCKHSRIDNHSTVNQMVEYETHSSQISDDKDFEAIISNYFDLTAERNIYTKVSVNSNLVPNKTDDNKDSSKSPIDKNIILTEDCIASEINIDKINFTDICIDETKDKNESYSVCSTDIQLTDTAHNKDEDNESVTSESILLGIELDEDYYFDSKNVSDNIKDSDGCKSIDRSDNLKTKLIDTCIEIHESSNDPLKMINEPSYLVAPDNIDDDCKNVSNSEMLVSLEEFDRILQRYNNEKEKNTHWDPNDYKNFNSNIKYPLSIDEIDEFISTLNDSQPNITKHTLFDEDLKDDVISISSEEHIELQNERYDDNNIDTISITSSESNCSGYHSSDFEFISEGEAKLDGLIINFVPPKLDKPVSKFARPNIIRSSNRELPPGPSNRSNREISANNHDTRKVITINEDHRQIHEIPEGGNYLNLFQGIYNPVLSNSAIYFLENKSVRVTGMHVEFEGLGFDRQMAERRRHDDSDDEFKEEAEESLKKILSMYPGENRKRRRRF